MSTEARILITGGRAPVALELARLFREAGHTVLAAESLKRHLCRVSRSVTASFTLPPPRQDPGGYVEGLTSIIDRYGVDLLVPTCEEVFHISKGYDKLAKHCRVFTEPLPVLAKLHHKYEFIRTAASAGLPVPETRLLTCPEEAEELYGDPMLFPSGIALKPAYSRFATRVVLMRRDGGDTSAPLRLGALGISAAQPWVAQEYLPGRQLCTYSIVSNGEIRAHTAYWTRYSAGAGASVHFEHTPNQEAFDWVRQFVKAIRYTGQIAFDFKEAPDGTLLPLECNPRATSGIHLLAGAPGIDRSFLTDASTPPSPPLIPADGTAAMLGFAMLGSGWQGKRTGRELWRWIQDGLRARDVVFRMKDPLPALEQLRMLKQFLRMKQEHGISLIEATTMDIEWNGEGR